MQKETPAGSQRPPPLERRLATIMMADVEGYSRMVGEAEERTIEILRGHREVFDELLAQHRGRVFNTAGDAILAEFPSAVEAVRCATEIQTALRTRNDHLPPEQRMQFRIGINLGDVIVQGTDLLGDGVNVAARIQTVAEAGGICISGSVYDQIQNKLALQFRQMGEKSFKNIAQPVRTFSIVDREGAASLHPVWRGRGLRRVLVGAVGALVLAALGAGYWQYRVHEASVAEAQRITEEQRKAEQQRAEAAAAQKESRLAAELQAAKEALTQAEASKRKAEQDRAATEAAQREARVQAELRSAKDAQQRAELIEKKTEEDRKAAAEALRAATEAASAAAKAAEATKEAKSAPAPVAAAKSLTAAASGPVERFDGAYRGRMCSVNASGSPRCWAVKLSVAKGVLSATWTSRSKMPAHAKGTISPRGEVKLDLDGYNARGVPMSGTLNGSWSDNKITVSGEWSNNVPVDATWQWAAADPDATVGPRASANDVEPDDDSGRFTGRVRGGGGGGRSR
jgi:class 3 adenylate cyclase